jgi:hypothetical protein
LGLARILSGGVGFSTLFVVLILPGRFFPLGVLSGLATLSILTIGSFALGSAWFGVAAVFGLSGLWLSLLRGLRVLMLRALRMLLFIGLLVLGALRLLLTVGLLVLGTLRLLLFIGLLMLGALRLLLLIGLLVLGALRLLLRRPMLGGARSLVLAGRILRPRYCYASQQRCCAD